MSDIAFVAAFALGSSVGLSLALTGAGGGILAVPLLVFVLHLSLAQAAPIGLLAVGLAAALGAVLGLREGTVRYRAALLIGGAGMLMAPLGVHLAQRVPNGPLTIAFAGVLAWAAISMYKRGNIARQGSSAEKGDSVLPCVRSPVTGRFVWTAPCAQLLTGTGLASGFLSGLLGVGGGFVIVPVLTRYSDLAAESVVGTSLAVIALVSLSAVASAAAHGAIDWPIALPFACGAGSALLAGRRLAARWSRSTLQRSFALLSLFVALVLLWRGLEGIFA
jgi:hypothetical protein